MHVGEHRHLREQHREADAAGRDQPPVAEQMRRSSRAPAGARAAACRAGSRGSHTVSTRGDRAGQDRERDERRLPARRRPRRGPTTARPVKPPRIVPVMYAAVRAAGVRSAATPRGCRRRCWRKSRRRDPLDEAPEDQLVQVVRRRGERRRDASAPRPTATITRRKPEASASRPMNGAKIATATVGAVMVSPASKVDASNVRVSSGSSGCVE